MSPSAARGVRSRLQRRLFEPPIRYGSGRADPYGIGIHAGVVIVGDIGFRGHTVFTALGDAVNVASRLQDLTKELDCKVVVSEEVCKTAGLAGNALTRRDVAIRGHDGAMAVRTAVDPTVLASLVDPVAESDEPLPTAVAAE